MKNSTLRFLLLVSVVLNLTILATVGYRYHQRSTSWTSPFGHRIARDRFLFEALSLKPEQKQAMKERAIRFRAGIDRQRTVITGKKRGLVTLLRQEPPDLPAIRALIAEISAMQEAMQQAVATHMLEEKGLLDQEQRHRFFDLIEEAMNKGSQTGCPSAD